MRRTAILCTLAATTLIVSCSIFTPAANNVTVYRKVDLDNSYSEGVHTLVLDAYERILLSKKKIPYESKGNPRNLKENNAPTYMVNCAEPSPDVFAATAIALSASAQLQKSAVGEVTAAGALASSIAQSAAQLQRQQTIQLLRDKMFNTCLAYANGALTPAQYHRMLTATGEASVVLAALDGLLPHTAVGSNQIGASTSIPGATPPAETASKPGASASGAAGGASSPAAGAPSPATTASAPAAAASGATAKAKAASLRSEVVFPILKQAVYHQATSDPGIRLISVAAVGASAPTSQPQTDSKTKSKNSAKPLLVAASPATGASAPPSTDPTHVSADPSPTVEAVRAVQYIVSKFMVNAFVHDCIDFYTARAQDRMASRVNSTDKPADANVNDDPEAGMDEFCQIVVARALDVPAASGSPVTSSVPASVAASGPPSTAASGPVAVARQVPPRPAAVARPAAAGGDVTRTSVPASAEFKLRIQNLPGLPSLSDSMLPPPAAPSKPSKAGSAPP